jgi:hypothetical protein
MQQDAGIEAAGKRDAHAGTGREHRRDTGPQVRVQVYSASSLNLP